MGFNVGEADGKHGADEVGKRRDAVHEDPEAGKSTGAGEDTVVFHLLAFA